MNAGAWCEGCERKKFNEKNVQNQQAAQPCRAAPSGRSGWINLDDNGGVDGGESNSRQTAGVRTVLAQRSVAGRCPHAGRDGGFPRDARCGLATAAAHRCHQYHRCANQHSRPPCSSRAYGRAIGGVAHRHARAVAFLAEGAFASPKCAVFIWLFWWRSPISLRAEVVRFF